MKIKVHIDSKNYKTKPSDSEVAGIKVRLQRNPPVNISLEGLIGKLETGHTICPAVMRGTHAADWVDQQLFMVDIDNEVDGCPLLTPEQAMDNCLKHKLPAAFYYNTFSHSMDKPKYRLAFIMDRSVSSPAERKMIMDTLISLFPQADKSCASAERIFHGTNKKAIRCDLDARITLEAIRKAYSPPASEKHHSAQNNHTEMRTNPELDALVRDFDFLSYLAERNGKYRESGNTVYFQSCEVCGHKDDLRYYKETNTFYCFSADGGVGGSILQYLMITEGLTLKEAISKLKYDLSDPDWHTPVPLEEYDLPPFPAEQLPAPLKDWVIAVAENRATAVDMAAVSALALVASAVQGKYVIRAKEGWEEPLNLFILIIAKSGERKSAVAKIMTKPVYQYEREENKKRQSKIDTQDARIANITLEIKRLEKKGNSTELIQKRLELRDLERNKTKLLRLIADDVTPEALNLLLANNGGVLTIVSTEGGLFDTLNGRYSNTVSIDGVLKAYTGESVRVDRRGSESITVDSPSLTILLSAQENVLEGIFSNEVFKTRGLTGRILYCKPESKMGSRPFQTPDIPKGLEEKYTQLLLDLLSVPLPQSILPIITLDPAAAALIEQFYNWVEKRLVGAFEGFSDWAAKCAGAALRIAGILHCVENRKSPEKVPVTERTVKRATKIAAYFIKHAKYAYSALGADKTMRDAKYILQRLKQKSEPTPRPASTI